MPTAERRPRATPPTQQQRTCPRVADLHGMGESIPGRVAAWVVARAKKAPVRAVDVRWATTKGEASRQ